MAVQPTPITTTAPAQIDDSAVKTTGFRRRHLTGGDYTFMGVSQFFLMIWALAVGYAQVYVGVHFPLDVAAGAALGAIIGLLVAALYNRRWLLSKEL